MGHLTDSHLAALDVIANKAARDGRRGGPVEVLPRNSTSIDHWAQDLGYREGLSMRSRKES